MAAWHRLQRAGVHLACLDFGGSGPSVLLLHGLAGHAEEWAQTASWLSGRARVLALDLRGHGHSERRPADVSPAALAADAAFALSELALAPAVVVGQSFGGLVAISLAAFHPELVGGLVVVEASPQGGAADAQATAEDIRRALGEWPLTFSSRREALPSSGSASAPSWPPRRGRQVWRRGPMACGRASSST